MADLVVEYDALSQALGGGTHASTMVARNAVITALKRGELDVGRAWIISANPDAESMFPHHEVVVLDPDGLDRGQWHGQRHGASGSTAQPSRAW